MTVSSETLASDPWSSLAVFALCVYIVQGILVVGEDQRVPAT